METAAAEDVIAAEEAAGDDTSVTVKRFQRRRGSGGRKPFPEHLRRERVEIEAPATCKCCGLADVLRRLPDMKQSQIAELLPWNWKPPKQDVQSVKPQ